MSRWHAGLRLAGYLIVLVASMACAGAVVVYNWRAAGLATPILPSPGSKARLRFYVSPRTTIAKGTRVEAGDLKARWGMLGDGEEYIATVRLAAGRYATENLQPAVPLRSRQVRERVPFSIPPCGVVVSVQVKGDHAAHLRPGMRLVFVAEKPSGDKPSGSNELRGPLPKPAWEHERGLHIPKGLELLAVTAAGSAAGGPTLLVTVPNEAKAVIPYLSAGEWRPIVVFSPPE